MACVAALNFFQDVASGEASGGIGPSSHVQSPDRIKLDDGEHSAIVLCVRFTIYLVYILGC